MNYATTQYVVVGEASSDELVCAPVSGNFIARVIMQPQSSTVESFYIQDGATTSDSELTQPVKILDVPTMTVDWRTPYVLELNVAPRVSAGEGRGLYMTTGAGALFTIVGMLDA